jgi:purine-cytosine permease-like protein
MDLRRALDRAASSTGKVQCGSFLTSVQGWKVSAAVCVGNHAIFRPNSTHVRVATLALMGCWALLTFNGVSSGTLLCFPPPVLMH